MKNFASNERTVIGLLALLILFSGKLSAQSEILGHTYAGSLNGHSYYISNCYYTTWSTANEAATQMGGYLVAITSEEENEFIEDVAPNLLIFNAEYRVYGGGVWTGLQQNASDGVCGIWNWSNGEPVVYTKWAFLEPYTNECGLVVIAGPCSGGQCVDEFESHWMLSDPNYYRQYMVEFDTDPGCNNPNKSYVCHNGNTICVNVDAVQAHVNHGDYAGPCGPCNSNAMQTLPEETIATDGHSHQPAKVMEIVPEDEFDIVHEEGTSNQLKVFPNPASEQMNVVLPEVTEKGTLRILSLTGQEIHVLQLQGQQSIGFDLTTYPAGIYLIDVRSANGHYQKKIVKL